ncbi:hypothetical protein [Sphingobium boeckii]|uniref:Uncharacterized protein n=1 Tax=Sphingobium boeckii TaxID=1082345 RepID=A0A7W9AHE2_9SPHN|nr:hypothetical protein [Sphingobium boeckii]MBB5685556.1 hypothetical protein [Sphingobium boeckii]
MTNIPDTGVDPAMARALDRFSVPAPSVDFADRILQAAQATPVSPVTGNRHPPVRGGRRWTRGRNIVIGTVAFGLMSATAAAAGLFGDIAVRVPVIGRLIAAATPESRPAKAIKVKRAAKVQEAPAAGTRADVPPAAMPQDGLAQRREIIAERIMTRVEQRDAQRAAMGLPSRTPRISKAVAALREAAPEQRAAMIETMRTKLQERRAAIRAGEMPTLAPRIAPAENAATQTAPATPLPHTGVTETEGEADAKALPARDTLRERVTADQLRQLRELREQRSRLRQQRRR